MKWQVYGAWVSLLISFVGLGLIIWKTEPQTSSIQVKVLFFITLFILIWSMATLVIFPVKNRLVKSRALSETAYEPIFYDSFLMGLFFSIIVLSIILIRRFFL